MMKVLLLIHYSFMASNVFVLSEGIDESFHCIPQDGGIKTTALAICDALQSSYTQQHRKRAEIIVLGIIINL